ncbi:hypothetical protein PT974_11367 [Cladobotryum mycophilum]|uniref:Uncharacterized protein n=1 Tax=Cladobotryum mycophilum TaxID=491253 RepID=A0ABR0S503_9HYPO
MDNQKTKAPSASKNSKNDRLYASAIAVWYCHICGGGPWLRSTTPACMECSHPYCGACSIYNEAFM